LLLLYKGIQHPEEKKMVWCICLTINTTQPSCWSWFDSSINDDLALSEYSTTSSVMKCSESHLNRLWIINIWSWNILYMPYDNSKTLNLLFRLIYIYGQSSAEPFICDLHSKTCMLEERIGEQTGIKTSRQQAIS
jgi:hypothetical protein